MKAYCANGSIARFQITYREGRVLILECMTKNGIANGMKYTEGLCSTGNMKCHS